uniref:Uncharacterized protein n=1 Tax=Heterorhabditis bacteriophora TaxID=37862 RepID=A0A1I7WBJ3_HETBA
MCQDLAKFPYIMQLKPSVNNSYFFNNSKYFSYFYSTKLAVSLCLFMHYSIVTFMREFSNCLSYHLNVLFFIDHTIWIEEVETGEKLSKIFQVKMMILLLYLGIYLTIVFLCLPIHLHLVDALIEGSIDIDKNITIYLDLLLVTVINNATTEIISSIENMVAVLDYDAELTVYNRSEYLTALIQTDGVCYFTKDVFGNIAFKSGELCGYSLGLNDRILQCYADDEITMKGNLNNWCNHFLFNYCIKSFFFKLLLNIY